MGDCARLFTETFTCAPWNEHWCAETALERLSGIMSAQVSRGYVCCENDGADGSDCNRIVAMACGRALAFENSKELFIDEFCVHPKFQGQGIGSGLLGFIQGKLKNEGISYIVLNTERDLPSREFYEKNGFYIKDKVIFMVQRVTSAADI